MVYSPIIEYVLVKNSVNRKGLALGIYSEGVIFYECDGITSLYVLSPGKRIRFYESHRYDQFECTDDDFFCFGSQYGKGTDENHFQLAFSSVNMLRNVENRDLFHLDATYRILKLCYPVIVIGVSDVNRKFFPIAFMITSHETEEDYLNFFTSFIKITSQLNLKFDPKYIVIDACKALAKAIKKCFPNCKIIMCYFHLTYNVSIFF